MHASYDDIISRVSSPPLWFDENAVPRYCAFEPSRSAGIHVVEIALAEISCQECQRLFRVAASSANFGEQKIAEAIRQKTLSYGDPPRHDGDRAASGSCMAGATMNSEPRRVLEYWYRHDPRHVDDGRIISVAWNSWVRDSSLEIDIQPEWVRTR